MSKLPDKAEVDVAIARALDLSKLFEQGPELTILAGDPSQAEITNESSYGSRSYLVLVEGVWSRITIIWRVTVTRESAIVRICTFCNVKDMENSHYKNLRRVTDKVIEAILQDVSEVHYSSSEYLTRVVDVGDILEWKLVWRG